MVSEDASRRQVLEGAVAAGVAVTVLPGAASAKDSLNAKSKGFVDPTTYGKDFFRTPYVSVRHCMASIGYRIELRALTDDVCKNIWGGGGLRRKSQRHEIICEM